jgi:hypothetical protein
MREANQPEQTVEKPKTTARELFDCYIIPNLEVEKQHIAFEGFKTALKSLKKGEIKLPEKKKEDIVRYILLWLESQKRWCEEEGLGRELVDFFDNGIAKINAEDYRSFFGINLKMAAWEFHAVHTDNHNGSRDIFFYCQGHGLDELNQALILMDKDIDLAEVEIEE